MINKEKIEKEILELESHDTTYATCEKLAILYVVLENMNKYTKNEEMAGELKNTLSGSEFLEACNNISYEKLMMILDEHMGVIKIMCPKEYNAVLELIKTTY